MLITSHDTIAYIKPFLFLLQLGAFQVALLRQSTNFGKRFPLLLTLRCTTHPCQTPCLTSTRTWQVTNVRLSNTFEYLTNMSGIPIPLPENRNIWLTDCRNALKSGFYRIKSSLFKPSVMQPISQRTFDLNNKVFIGYSSHDLNNEPFNDRNSFGPSKYQTNPLFWFPLYFESPRFRIISNSIILSLF